MVDIPAPFVDLAKRRTEFLFRVMQYSESPLPIILASAYLQGINDAVDAIENKAKREAAISAPLLPWHC
ncbi:hypothetical protein ACQR1Y_11900 [Bradyrhizobium sp. HKCCYLRH3099]|uniref:hypothetical protein n=1 Tax=unclassified Bradyrhizobium TaxID=2631580 RepID=UPI003EB86233